MLLDKGLILKGLAGIAAVGGIATTGVALKEGTALNKLLFSSPKAGAEVQSDQIKEENLTENKHDASKASEDHSALQVQDTVGSGDTASQLRTGDAPGGIVSGGSLSSAPALDEQGIPTKCKTSSPCVLTEEELKKIKFEAVGDEDTPEVTVEEFPTGDQKLTLTIDSTDTTKKKYIFSNTSSKSVDLKRGTESPKTVTLGAGRTKFTLDSTKKRLKQFDLDDYGLPSDCKSSCTLTYTDLEDIKFDGLDGPLTVEPKNQKVSLSIETVSSEKRFTFSTSSSSITIKNGGSTSVTLESGKSRFKGTSGNKMKKIELDDKGIPSDCNSTCTLTADDLKHVKFPGFEGLNDPVTVEPSNKTISLTINSSKYQFNESSGTAINIKKGNVTITLTGSTSTVFSEENGKLVKETSLEILNKKIKTAGFPVEESCSGNNKCCQFKEGDEEIDCKLTKEEFKKLKFKNLDGGVADENALSNIGSDFKVKIKKIKGKEKENYSPGTDLKFIFDGFNNSLNIQKSGSSDVIYLKGNSDTEFVLNSSGKLERAWSRQTLGSKLGLECGTGFDCTVKGPINLIASGSQKYEGMTKSGSGSDKFKVITSANYREGYIFKVEEANIILTGSSGSQTLTKEYCYEAKWDTDKWWLAHKANSCSAA